MFERSMSIYATFNNIVKGSLVYLRDLIQTLFVRFSQPAICVPPMTIHKTTLDNLHHFYRCLDFDLFCLLEVKCKNNQWLKK